MTGIRIIDCTRVLAGPWATQQLADQGADVIKVEPPGGDETRGYGPIVDGRSTYFDSVNRNKRSVVLDLTTPEDRAHMGRLLATADVLVDNVRSPAARKLGLDADTVRQIAPHIVHVALRGFAPDAPEAWRDQPGYDNVIQALSGAMHLTGMPDGPPVRSGLPIADLIAGLLVTQAVLLGLLERGDRSHAGNHTVVDMMTASVASLVYHASRETQANGAGSRLGNAHAGLVPYNAYRCADGWVSIGCGNDRIWTRLKTVLALTAGPELDRNIDRIAQRAHVDALVSDALAPLSVQDAVNRLVSADVPAAPVLDVAQALAHPATRTMNVDGVRVVGPMLRTATTRQTHHTAPSLGEHSDEVLSPRGSEIR